MGRRVTGPVPTAREREVARLIGLGLTNREIAAELGISERTVGAHVQNILNKLGATNRAQVASWSAAQVGGPVPQSPAATDHAVAAASPVVPRPWSFSWASNQVAIILGAGLLLSVALPADHQIQPTSAAAALSSQRGDQVFEAQFLPDGSEFSLRYALNDPAASAVRFVNGGLEYSVLRPGGNTGNRPAVVAMPAFFAEFELSVQPKSNVEFWIGFTNDDASKYGVHLLSFQTGIEAMQLAYYSGEQAGLPLGPQVSIDAMQKGRHFTISTLVAPPNYRVFLDGVRVIDVYHESPRRLQAPNFAIFGDGGTVRLSKLRVYKID